MRRLCHNLLQLTLLLLCAVGLSIPTDVRADGSWLNSMPGTWNRPDASVPGAIYAGANLAECQNVIRAAEIGEESAVTGAGWHLFGPRQTLEDIVVFSAASDFEGQCRPRAFQTFVFVGGKFAGTLSPVPMDSRTDGALISAVIANQNMVYAEFARYRPDDATCCPTTKSRVFYSLNRTASPFVIADNTTEAALEEAPAVASSQAPQVTLSLSHDRVEPGERFRVTIQADGQDMDRVWWWATDTADDDITPSQERSCTDAQDCREEWRISTTDAGTVIFHAKGRDKQGRESDEVTKSLRIRFADGRPTVVVNVSDAEDNHFNLNIVAKDDKGIESMTWRIVDADNDTREERKHDCGRDERCEKDWRERIPSGRKLKIHTQAVDHDGLKSDEIIKELRGGGSNKNEKPTVELELSEDSISEGDRVRITVRGRDDHGLASIVWWATDTDDKALSENHEQKCDEDEATCEHTWRVRPDDSGRIKIHARARDDDGRNSEEVVQTLRIR